LIGEHTDYHQGFVLPTVIPQRTTIALRVRDDQRVRISSDAMDGSIKEFTIGREARDRSWLDYIKGVTAAVAAEGAPLAGFDAAVVSTIPTGGGVSSSAALMVALLRAVRAARLLDRDDFGLAMLAHRAETEFVGAPVGKMDQMACSLGRPGAALFIDTRTLEFEAIELPADAGLIVIDSGITHTHAGGAYVRRREESFAAAAALGVQWLRDARDGTGSFITDPMLQRRARHVITENARVIQAVDALRAGDLPRLGRLFSASHASQRDDYETSTPEIDALVAIGERHPAVFGARLTGGGFGGCVVMLAKASEAARAAQHILDEYRRSVSPLGTVLVPT
jgi:galactokinase